VNAVEQARAAARLAQALVHAGVRVERLANDRQRLGAAKHALQPVDPAVLIGAWLSKGFVVTVGVMAEPQADGADR
jgi:hypothetical protein